MSRPYFKSKIEELEKLFCDFDDNLVVLDELHEELIHRNTLRSKELYDKVKEKYALLIKQSDNENNSSIITVMNKTATDSSLKTSNPGEMMSDMSTIHTNNEQLDKDKQLIIDKIEKSLRPKLLDFSRRNPLISTNHSPRSASFIRVVDELPDVLFFKLSNNERMYFDPLPPLDIDPLDENSEEFQHALSEAHLLDEEYLKALESINPTEENAAIVEREAERSLRDRLRDKLGMAPRQKKHDVRLDQHAKNNGISPSYDLPKPVPDGKDEERHLDDAIQTLLLPNKLERNAKGIISKARTWQQETGLNVLHAAIGFLEWTDPNNEKVSIAPLVLMPILMTQKQTRQGPKIWVEGTGDPAETNYVLTEFFKRKFSLNLPLYEKGSIEDYMELLEQNPLLKLRTRIRRFVTFGVFPSARMALFHDLDTSNPNFAVNNIVDQLLLGVPATASTPFAEDYNVDDPKIEAKVPLLVADADSSQFSALVDIADGKNLAIEGPPGTGKSQTILNAIATALSDGKKVLFVAEKLAALEVVRSRLEDVGLGEYVLPLLADRSSREEIIKSLKTRVNMNDSDSPENLSFYKSQFLKVRDEISEYIDILSRPWAGTDFQVYQILGRAISTRDILVDLPDCIKKPRPIRNGIFSQNDISQLHELANIFKDCIQDTKNTHPLWNYVGIDYNDPYVIDEILADLLLLANSYLELKSLKDKLLEMCIPENISTEALVNLYNIIITIISYSEHHNIEIITTIISNNYQHPLCNYYDNIVSLSYIHDQLASTFNCNIDNTLLNYLNNIISYASLFDISHINSNNIDSLLNDLKHRTISLEYYLNNLQPLVVNTPLLSNVSINILTDIGNIINKYSDKVLINKNVTISDANNRIFLENSIKYIRHYRQDYLDLMQLFTLDSLDNNYPVNEILCDIKNAGIFSFFSSKYRNSKQLYNSISKRNVFNKTNATNDLQKLSDWKSKNEKYDNIISETMSRLKLGRDIVEQPNRLSELLRYYQEIEEVYPKIRNAQIHTLLDTAPVEVLRELSTLTESEEDVPFAELEELINNLYSNMKSLNMLHQLTTNIGMYFKNSLNITINDIREISVKVSEYTALQDSIDNCNVASLLEEQYDGIVKNSDTLKDIVEITNMITSSDYKDTFVYLLNGGKGRIQEGKEILNRYNNIIGEIDVLQSNISRIAILSDKWQANASANMPLEQYYKSASNDKTGLISRINLNNIIKELEKYGLKEEIQAILNCNDIIDIPKIYEAMLYQIMAREVYHKYGNRLSYYNGMKLTDLRKKVAQLDRKIIKLEKQELRIKLKNEACPPTGIGRGRKSDYTEMSLIHHEIQKKKRYIPVRDLVHRAGKSLLELKPCWMMSPLAIAQYLAKGELNFDLCIIDEASQMPPEDAIGALLRSNKAVIVGDTNQLPPTNFFRKMYDEEEEEEEDLATLEESILQMANNVFYPARRLKWHYRSRHSSLIRFSNKLVYDDELVVFPSANESVSHMGVFLVETEGLYRTGTNPIEADSIIRHALKHMHEDPERSLGIVTMNQKQKDLLDEKMDYAMSRDKRAQQFVQKWREEDGGLYEFFIKNLENVQGDERDVIFIGTVYGPQKKGIPVEQRFGPINGNPGKRRLNVLFSRAREKTVTFTSMKSTDIIADEYTNPGRYMLKRWLEYSKTGILEEGTIKKGEPDSAFEVYVAEQIRSMGIEVVHQVGDSGYYIDLGLKHPSGGYFLGIECDGASYHSSKSARDRDRLRQEVLEAKGWHFHRIWSTDWFLDHKAEIARLGVVIDKRLSELKKIENEFLYKPVVPKEPDEFEFVEEEREVDTLFDESILEQANEEESEDIGISTGYTVRVKYIGSELPDYKFTIIKGLTNKDKNLVNVDAPICRAVLGREIGDEVQIPLRDRLVPVRIESATV